MKKENYSYFVPLTLTVIAAPTSNYVIFFHYTLRGILLKDMTLNSSNRCVLTIGSHN